MNVNNVKITGGEVFFTFQFNFKYLLFTALLILMAVTTYLLYPKGDYTNEALFKEYFADLHYNDRAGDDEIGAMVRAMQLIKDEHYHDAIQKLDEIYQDKKIYSSKAQWYKGLCLLKTNAEDDVIMQHFGRIIMEGGDFANLSLEILSKRNQQKKKKQPKILAP
ncbi:hypothetical protein DF185_19755 [Marinifilum breve]|uniref:Tetratricopeptide repeat-like domain-containing protein n=1 Tax=Marinifilum breve TaxID=2184082 RepID=A0A2V3ZT66_9BACT|nr:hypothetical protein [Marinifilum breve]PXX96877.1 hypothetical protein DF185_19755 [Marinifilum breve]